MLKLSRQPRLLFGTIFLGCTGIIWLLTTFIKGFPLNQGVLLWGNTILLVATLFSFSFYKRSLQNNQVGYFLKMIYGGMFVKMIICMVAAITYILIARSAVDKFGLLACFGLYFIYTFAEVKLLMQLSKDQKNA